VAVGTGQVIQFPPDAQAPLADFDAFRHSTGNFRVVQHAMILVRNQRGEK
jgi:hypothetical protein